MGHFPGSHLIRFIVKVMMTVIVDMVTLCTILNVPVQHFHTHSQRCIIKVNCQMHEYDVGEGTLVESIGI